MASAIFAAALPLEMRHWGKKLGRPRVETVYFGGGTPSLLPPWALSRIMPEIGRHFDLDPAVEWTFEANPDSALDGQYLKSLLKYGVNRLSLGVQSLSDADLRFLGRPHDAAGAVAAYGLARQAGFKNISLDFIWGLPGQREAVCAPRAERSDGLSRISHPSGRAEKHRAWGGLRAAQHALSFVL